MSKMAQLASDLQDLVEAGMSAKFIVATLGVSYEDAQKAIEDRELLELEKQNVLMSYEDIE